MKWRKTASVVLTALMVLSMVLSMAGCSVGGGDGESFADYVNASDAFWDVPAMLVDGTYISDSASYGNGCYILTVSGTELSDYQAYITKLVSEDGFTKFVDNGENGLGSAVYTTTLTKSVEDGESDLELTVWHIVKAHKTYVSAKSVKAGKLNLSQHLFADNKESTDPDIAGAKTTLSMVQPTSTIPKNKVNSIDYGVYSRIGGECYVIQLKNGHFIVEDSGEATSEVKLLEYLEELSGGKKPIIDAFFITHEHSDHCYGLRNIANSYSSRVSVEGVYFSETDSAVNMMTKTATGTVVTAASKLKTSDGKTTPVYRTHVGERYYFNEVTIEVPYTQELLPLDEYAGDQNGASSWFLHYIEGQKFLNFGDTERINIAAVAAIYDDEYMDVDIMNSAHHGHNIYAGTENYNQAETVLYDSYGLFSTTWGAIAITANMNLQASAKECVSYLNGTVVLEFPYTVGSYEVLDTWYPDITNARIEEIRETYKAATYGGTGNWQDYAK